MASDVKDKKRLKRIKDKKRLKRRGTDWKELYKSKRMCWLLGFTNDAIFERWLELRSV